VESNNVEEIKVKDKPKPTAKKIANRPKSKDKISQKPKGNLLPTRE
jgi:hypothetical protein